MSEDESSKATFGSPVHLLPMSISLLQWNAQAASCDKSRVGNVGRAHPAAVRGAVGPPVGTRQRAAPPLHYWLETYDHPARTRRTGYGPTAFGLASRPKCEWEH